jgi:hypothetical protein
MGQICGKTRSLLHEVGKACSTSNLIAHLRDKAKNSDVAHQKALLDVTSQVDPNKPVKHNFAQAFPHHVDAMWMRAANIVSRHASQG